MMNHRPQLPLAIALIALSISAVYAQRASSSSFGSRSTLGVRIQEVTDETAQKLGLAEPHGVLVVGVQENSPAQVAGMRKNDLILSFNGHRIEGTRQLSRLLGETPGGRVVNLGLWRDQQEHQLQARLISLNAWPAGSSRRTPRHQRLDRSLQGPRLGIQVMSLRDQLAEFFGGQPGRGILVTSVSEQSLAAEAGLRAGDVILAIDGREMRGISDLSSSLRRAVEAVKITVLRDHAQIELQARLKTGGENSSMPTRRRHRTFRSRRTSIL